ncbi:MAG: radical SAM protein [Thermodesulfobacteriota bacterium]
MKINRRRFLRHSLLLGSALLFPSGSARASPPSIQSLYPAYLELDRTGELSRRVKEARTIFEECRLCPRRCGVNRLAGEKGFCRAPSRVMVYSAQPHYGEEISLTGREGSGTIFFSNCNLRCVFCQNWPIAHAGEGKQIEDEDLAGLMLFLQQVGCHNINLVTPTHVMPNILKAVQLAGRKGLRLPLVYNTSGYERLEILELLNGIVDIYLPDLKYMDPKQARTYSSGAADYPEVTQQAIIEMHRQVGTHQTDADGIARRGLMIRHLVMPNRVAGTEQFVRWVARSLPRSTYVNIMPQYHVAYRAFEFPQIARGITVEEFLEAMDWAETYGLTNLDPRSVEIRNLYRKS